MFNGCHKFVCTGWQGAGAHAASQTIRSWSPVLPIGDAQAAMHRGGSKTIVRSPAAEHAGHEHICANDGPLQNAAALQAAAHCGGGARPTARELYAQAARPPGAPAVARAHLRHSTDRGDGGGFHGTVRHAAAAVHHHKGAPPALRLASAPPATVPRSDISLHCRRKYSTSRTRASPCVTPRATCGRARR